MGVSVEAGPVNRRTVLGAVAGFASGLAGCGSDPAGGGGATGPTGTRTADEGPTVARTASRTPDPNVPLARRGKPADICSEDVLPVGIAAITDPSFAPDWSAHETADYGGDLEDDTVVVGLERAGRTRAYPIRVLWRHEVVNDDLGAPLVVTFCPLCASGLVAECVVDGAPATFGVSGLLWHPPGAETRRSRDEGRIFGASLAERESTPRPERDENLVMYDAATGSYWS